MNPVSARPARNVSFSMMAYWTVSYTHLNAKAPLPDGEVVTGADLARGEWRGVLTTVEAGGSIA